MIALTECNDIYFDFRVLRSLIFNYIYINYKISIFITLEQILLAIINYLSFLNFNLNHSF